MASLLDLLLGGQGGLLALPPSPQGDQWLNAPYRGDMQSRLKIGRDVPTDRGGYLMQGAPGLPAGLSPYEQSFLNPNAIAPDQLPPQEAPSPMAASAPNLNMPGVSPTGFGFSPAVAAPTPAYQPPTPQPPGPLPPAMQLENRPPTAGTSRGDSLPNTVARPAPQQQQPTYAPPQRAGPDVGGNLLAGFQNLFNNPTLAGLGQAFTGFTTGQRTDPVGASQQIAQRTYETLRQAGYSHSDAVLAATNPAVLNEMVKNAYQQPKLEFGPPGSTPYAIGGGRGQLGPGRDAQITQLPGGISIQEKAAQEAAGQKQGQAAAVLPQTLTMADNALKTLDELQNHPGRQGLFAPTGTLGKLPPIPGTQGYDFVQRLKQAQGQIFISIFNQLRGGGSISDAEGEKGTQAAANLDRAQTPQAFDRAANDLRDVITKGRANAIKIAQGDTQPFATPQQPQAPQGQAGGGGGWTNVAPNIRVRPRQ